MKKIIYIVLLSLSPLFAQAACKVIPLNTAQLSYDTSGGELISGQVVKGEECRGVASRADYTADQYSFQGTEGDTIKIYTYSKVSFIAFLDPQGVQFTNNANSIGFSFRLPSTGNYKIIITGNTQDVADVKDETIDYNLQLTSSNPKQTSSPAPITSVSCPSDTYTNGKLTINSVEVSDGLGGTLKYKATLSLMPFANPLSFSLDHADPIR